MGKQKYTQVQKQKKCKNMNPKYNPQCKINKQKYVEKKTQIKTHRQRACNNYRQTTNKKQGSMSQKYVGKKDTSKNAQTKTIQQLQTNNE